MLGIRHSFTSLTFPRKRIDRQAGVGLVQDGDLDWPSSGTGSQWRFFSPPEKPSLTLRSAKAGSHDAAIAALASLTQCRGFGSPPNRRAQEVRSDHRAPRRDIAWPETNTARAAFVDAHHGIA